MRTLARAAVLCIVWPGFAAPAAATEDAGLLERLEAIAEGRHKKVAEAREDRSPYYFAIEIAAARHRLPPSLLRAVVRVESNFDPEAVSPVGAQGIAQLMPATARDLGVLDPFDPRQNLDGAAAYLSAQIERFESVRLALAAYHAGPKRARSALRDRSSMTYQYVQRVLAYEREFRKQEDL